jgi:arsenite methyltransferase
MALAQVPHQHHPPRSAEEYAHVLNHSSRDAWQKPHEVVMALELRAGDTVADIGAGTGYFTLRFARHAGKVYAVDIDEKLLGMLREKAPENVDVVLAAPDDPKLPPASADVIFFCNVLHHIDHRPAYLRKLKSALKPGGRIVNIDFYKKPLPVGPPPGHKLSEDEVKADFAAAGFRLTASKADLLPHQYWLEFQPE